MRIRGEVVAIGHGDMVVVVVIAIAAIWTAAHAVHGLRMTVVALRADRGMMRAVGRPRARNTRAGSVKSLGAKPSRKAGGITLLQHL